MRWVGLSIAGGTSLSTQFDITRLRSLVIHSLYSHKDVFLRELLSNANDAMEKLRITALTERGVMGAGEANVTIEVRLDEGGKTGQLVIRGGGRGWLRRHRIDLLDTGIGMTKRRTDEKSGHDREVGNERISQEGGGGRRGGWESDWTVRCVGCEMRQKSSNKPRTWLLLLVSLAEHLGIEADKEFPGVPYGSSILASPGHIRKS